jgi:uncharacterized protein YdeI (YjbR/CyaY-like superfamily)
MATKSADVDRYIANAAPFAKPILEKIRKAYHKASPDIVETMKWSVPFFEYKGILGNMAAFKQHVSFGFWKGKLMNDAHGVVARREEAPGMGGSRVSDVSELPAEKVLVEYIREAMRLNDEGVKNAPRVRKPAKPLEVPAELTAALKKNKAAHAAFKTFPVSHQREYSEWIAEAKQDATKAKRVATAVEWIAEGKSRNWKYERKK